MLSRAGLMAGKTQWKISGSVWPARRLPVRGEFIKSRGNRRLVQPATVLLPAIRGKVYRRRRSARIWQAVTPHAPEQFAGQRVKVTRTLFAKTGIIQVEEFECSH